LIHHEKVNGICVSYPVHYRVDGAESEHGKEIHHNHEGADYTNAVADQDFRNTTGEAYRKEKGGVREGEILPLGNHFQEHEKGTKQIRTGHTKKVTSGGHLQLPIYNADCD
jgi:hypothetical protein